MAVLIFIIYNMYMIKISLTVVSAKELLPLKFKRKNYDTTCLLEQYMLVEQ